MIVANTPTVRVMVDESARGSFTIYGDGIERNVLHGNRELVTFSIPIAGLPLNDTTICFGADVQIIALPALTNYNWSVPSGISVNDPQIFNPVFSGFLQNSTTTLSVEAEGSDGCPFAGSVNVSTMPGTGPNISVPPVCPNGGGQISGDETFTDYIWTAVTPGVSYTPDNIASPFFSLNDLDENDIVILRYTARDPEGCLTTDTIRVEFLPAALCEVEFPNVFTPGGQNELNRSFHATGCLKKSDP